jgi:phospholipid/cholesterol/gamma-HCH transport system ATP-binding protein
VGIEVRIEGLTKSFGRQVVWSDVSFSLPPNQISVLLGPSGTGKSVFLKTLVGLLTPDRGSIVIDGRDITKLSERRLYKVRRLFGVLFQDGALFGSMSLYDNIAFPLREHTRKSEAEIRRIVGEKMDMVGLIGAESKLPGQISGGMRKRAGLARALVLNPQIVLFDEPDSGLDPVRSAYLNQLIVDLNTQTGATFLIVTHDVTTARTVPDNIGLLYQRHLAMFGHREMVLTSTEPVVRQFLNAQRFGPIGMAEEKDTAELEAEAATGYRLPPLPPIPLQLQPSDGSVRPSQRAPGEWCRQNGVRPPAGSFEDPAEESQPPTPTQPPTTQPPPPQPAEERTDPQPEPVAQPPQRASDTWWRRPPGDSHVEDDWSGLPGSNDPTDPNVDGAPRRRRPSPKPSPKPSPHPRPTTEAGERDG